MNAPTEDHDGPMDVTGVERIDETLTRNVRVLAGGELRIAGTVQGDVEVEAGGTLVVAGTVKGAITNKGGAVDIFGFVGRVVDTGGQETFVSRGAIIGGKRAPRPAKLSRFLRT